MSAASNDDAYGVQRLRGGFALVWREDGKRRRKQLQATDRQSAEAEARAEWAVSQGGDWTVGRCMMAYLTTIARAAQVMG